MSPAMFGIGSFSRRAVCFALLILSPAAACSNASKADAEGARNVNSTIHDAPDHNGGRYGALQFVGGIHINASFDEFGGFSGMTLRGETILAVTDRGDWLEASIERDDAGRLSGVSNVRLTPLLGADGAALDGKANSDAESVAPFDGAIAVSFERDHRIDLYDDIGAAALPLASFGDQGLPANKG
ncbi:MAG: esterase-like activity of phytase family protein, partial [Pseudomonadota bacterium]